MVKHAILQLTGADHRHKCSLQHRTCMRGLWNSNYHTRSELIIFSKHLKTQLDSAMPETW